MRTVISNVADVVRASRPLTQPDFVIDYYVNGLTYASNDTTILPRDTAGNISIEPSSSNLLVIEPIIDKITTTSALKVIDTSFQYYKFPVSTVNSGLSVDLNIADSEEILFTELILPTGLDSRNQIIDLDNINTSYESTWYYGTYNSSGFKSLPFTGGAQPKANGYTITQDAIDLLREKNKTLKFRIQLQFLPRYQNGPTSIQVRLNRTNPKAYRNFKQIILYSEGRVGPIGDAVNNPYNFRPINEYPYFEMDYYIDMNDIVANDYYVIEAVAGNETWCLNSNGFWNIEPADIPTAPGYYGSSSDSFKNAGVYYISPNTVLRDANNNDIGKKTVTTNQEFEFI